MAMRVISKFNKSVITKIEPFDASSDDYYSAIRSAVYLYAYLDSGLANKKLVMKYLSPDLKFVAKRISFIVDGFIRNRSFKGIAIKYIKVMIDLGFSYSQLVKQFGDVEND